SSVVSWVASRSTRQYWQSYPYSYLPCISMVSVSGSGRQAASRLARPRRSHWRKSGGWS
ncbi:hypothetical protein LTS18_013766, partial [Coniosporium uncinatum]